MKRSAPYLVAGISAVTVALFLGLAYYGWTHRWGTPADTSIQAPPTLAVPRLDRALGLSSPEAFDNGLWNESGLLRLAAKAEVEHDGVLLRGACHTTVLQEQDRRKADLLVMGAYRATTVKTDLMAREKQLILDEIACPVLIVPAGRR